MTDARVKNRRAAMRRFRPSRLPLFIASLWTAVRLTTPDSFATGTPAGTIISNYATVAYTMEGTPRTRNSNVTTLVVDDKVSLTLNAADAANVTITPGGRAYMTYTLTNTGNAPHDFTFSSAVTGIPDLLPASGPTFYADAAGTIPLPTDPNTGSLPYISSLAPDSGRTVYMFITAPAQLTDGQTITYIVTSETYQPANLGVSNPPLKSSAQAAVDATANKNANLMTRYVVLADSHGNGGDADRDGKYAVVAKDGNGIIIGFKSHSATVSVVKSVTVADRLGSSQPISGGTLRYALSVSAKGTGTAMGVVIADPIPANTTYTAGTLKLNGSTLSDAVDSDAGDVSGTTAGTVTVRLGDMTSASPPQIITFDVKID